MSAPLISLWLPTAPARRERPEGVRRAATDALTELDVLAQLPALAAAPGLAGVPADSREAGELLSQLPALRGLEAFRA
jgi:hypothetical protein